jgi:glycosyltransferase involved in cell wall biosynthesis
MKLISDTRILMTADTVGGVWTYATGLASALAARGADMYLVSMGPRPRADQREMLSKSVTLIESDLALEWQDPEGADLERAREFLGTVERQVEPALVHLNGYREAIFEWDAPVVVVAHSCVKSWAVACQDTTFLAEQRWQHYTRLVASGLDRADAWVSPTYAFGDVVRDLYQPRPPQTVIWNGIAPARSPLGNETPLILAAGRMWDAAKNLSLLAEAARDLDWPVFVAGTTASSAGKLACGIEIMGELSHAELAGRMGRAAIFVSPARYEPFGLSVLEAAAAGCALVLSDIPGFHELWNGAALFFSPNDVSALRAALTDLCGDPDARASLQRAARARARRYSLSRMSAAYVRLYCSLLPRRSIPQSGFAEVCA